MKIKSYAGGGIAYLPTTTNRGEAASAASSSSSSSKVPGFADKILDMIGEEGLDADVNTFLTRVQRTLDLAGDPRGENISMREIMALTRDASLVKTNYTDYTKARENLDKQQAWGDVALNSRGQVYVHDSETNKIKTVSLSEYKSNTNKYLALTNEELLNQRRQDPSLAYNNGVLDDVYRAVGLKTIIDYTNDLIKNFKSTEIQGYSEKKGKSIQTGLEEIVNGTLADGNSIAGTIEAGPDGIYRVKQSSTVVDTDIKGALNYLYNALPNEYKHSLQARAIVEGYDPDALLLSMLTANTGRSIETTFDDSMTKRANGESGSGSEAMNQHTLAEGYADGQDLPGMPAMLPIAPNGATSTLLTYGQNAGPVLKDASGKPGNPLGVANIPQLFEDAYGIRNITSNTVVFGDQLINTEQLGGLVYDGSDMHRVVMPCKIINGGRDVVPDFELQEKLDNITQTAVNQGADESTINRLIQEVCPGAKYNGKTGGITLPRDKQGIFLTFGAMAAENYIDFNGESKYLAKSSKNADVYEEAVKYGYANHGAKDPVRVSGSADAGFMGTWFGRTKRNLYEGNVFIPVTSKAAGTSFYNQEYVPKSAYTNITGRAIESERQAMVRDRLADDANRNW